jgi:hypothetical protein
MFAPTIHLDRLFWLLLQLFLCGGVAANYFDEIRGRPWHTRIPERHLWTIGLLALSASSLIGLYLSLHVSFWFAFFTIVWDFFAIAYDLELFNGLFHNTPSLALSWGSVTLGSYYLHHLRINTQILIVSIITSYIAGFGRNLYEVAKPFSKDKDPNARAVNRVAWGLLKRQILFINVLALTMVTYRLLSN